MDNTSQETFRTSLFSFILHFKTFKYGGDWIVKSPTKIKTKSLLCELW